MFKEKRLFKEIIQKVVSLELSTKRHGSVIV